MGNKKRWVETDEGHGIVSIAVSRWKHFPALVHEHFTDTKSYIWRGQRCSDWPLQPTLQRQLPGHIKAPEMWAKSHLHRFRYATRGRRGPVPAKLDDDNDAWALGQHFGLATPLLDWSTSPFVGAFFAFSTTGEKQTATRTVFALHQPLVSSRSTQIRNKADADDTSVIEFVRPRSDENARLVNQAGLFTRSPLGFTLESWVRDHFKSNTKARVLLKITVPDDDRDDALRMLNRMNINHLTLFPDLDGAAKFVNMHLDIAKY